MMKANPIRSAVVLAAASLMLGAGPVEANGTSKSKAGAAPAASWSGCYVGAHAGPAATSTEVGIVGGGFSLDGLSAKGLGAGGAHAGCDGQFGGVVVGVRGEYAWLDQEFNVGPGFFKASFDNAWTALARVGVPVAGGRALPYVLAGYTRAETSWSIPGVAMPDFHGLVLGGGIEVSLAANVSLGLEGRWTKYQSETISGTPITLEPEQVSALATLNLRFPSLFSSGAK